MAYIAGLLDGEGCINIYKITTDYIRQKEKRKVPKFVLSVTIYNCDYAVLLWLYRQFGGYLQTRSKRSEKWKDAYAWKLSANVASDFLESIKRYLRIKKRQAGLAIQFQENQSRFHRFKKGKPAGMSKKDFDFRERCWKKNEGSEWAKVNKLKF